MFVKIDDVVKKVAEINAAQSKLDALRSELEMALTGGTGTVPAENANKERRESIANRIRMHLAGVSAPTRIQEIADAVKVPKELVGVYLSQMTKRGELNRVARATYLPLHNN